MTIVTDQPVIATQFEDVQRQSRAIVALEKLRDAALSALVEALAAAGFEVARADSTGPGEPLELGDVAHVLEQVDYTSGYTRFCVLKPGTSGFAWTKRPVDSGPHYFDSDRQFGHFYRGEQVYLGTHDNKALFVRPEALQSLVAKETI